MKNILILKSDFYQIHLTDCGTIETHFKELYLAGMKVKNCSSLDGDKYLFFFTSTYVDNRNVIAMLNISKAKRKLIDTRY